MKTRQTLFFICILMISLFFSCSKEEEETPGETNNNTTNNTTEQNYTNYIQRGDTKFELHQAHIISGLYDGGPNYYTAIWLCDSNVTFTNWSDDVNAFTGIGSGALIHFYSADSLVSDTFPIEDGWAATDNFNFENPEGDIYDLNNLPPNFIRLEGLNVNFTNNGELNFSLSVEGDDVDVIYDGEFEWVQ